MAQQIIDIASDSENEELHIVEYDDTVEPVEPFKPVEPVEYNKLADLVKAAELVKAGETVKPIEQNNNIPNLNSREKRPLDDDVESIYNTFSKINNRFYVDTEYKLSAMSSNVVLNGETLEFTYFDIIASNGDFYNKTMNMKCKKSIDLLNELHDKFTSSERHCKRKRYNDFLQNIKEKESAKLKEKSVHYTFYKPVQGTSYNSISSQSNIPSLHQGKAPTVTTDLASVSASEPEPERVRISAALRKQAREPVRAPTVKPIIIPGSAISNAIPSLVPYQVPISAPINIPDQHSDPVTGKNSNPSSVTNDSTVESNNAEANASIQPPNSNVIYLEHINIQNDNGIIRHIPTFPNFPNFPIMLSVDALKQIDFQYDTMFKKCEKMKDYVHKINSFLNTTLPNDINKQVIINTINKHYTEMLK